MNATKTPNRPSQVRIIGGKYRGRKLMVADAPGLRPTPDRVRETLFNWLGQNLTGWSCLDLFAGSGVLGFEAASRGAASVVLVEHALKVARGLQTAADMLKDPNIHVVCMTAERYLQQSHLNLLNLVFLDPPYGQGWLERILPILLPHLAENAMLYIEAEFALPAELTSELTCLKAGRAGQVHYHLYCYKTGTE